MTWILMTLIQVVWSCRELADTNYKKFYPPPTSTFQKGVHYFKEYSNHSSKTVEVNPKSESSILLFDYALYSHLFFIAVCCYFLILLPFLTLWSSSAHHTLTHLGVNVLHLPEKLQVSVYWYPAMPDHPSVPLWLWGRGGWGGRVGVKARPYIWETHWTNACRWPCMETNHHARSHSVWSCTDMFQNLVTCLSKQLFWPCSEKLSLVQWVTDKEILWNCLFCLDKSLIKKAKGWETMH